MALMIPHKPYDTQSEGELAIFDALQQGLDNDYIVFHSVRWVSSSNKSQGEADYLILHKSLGLLVLEVKSGYIRCEGRRWFQKNRNTLVEKEIQDPLSQADGSKFKFIELLKESNPSIKGCLVCHAVWYPSIQWTFPYPPHYSPEIVFDSETLSKPQKAIEAAFNYWGNSVFKSTYGNAAFEQLKFIIAPEFSAVPSVRANFESRERQFITLTRDQARIMDFLDEQKTAVISGSAGTGKTMLALEKANRLGVRNEETLFLCYNEALRKHLEDNNPITCVRFKTIHELARSFNISINSKNLNEVTDSLAYHLLSNSTIWPYTNVVIDEAQDFNSFFIEVLKDITKGSFYAFYDKNQSIHQQGELTWANNADCKLTLHTNCRNTKEIARTSARNIGLDSKTFINSPVKGEQSFIAEYKSEEAGLNTVEKIVNHLLNDKKAKPEDIVVLTMSDIDNSILRNVKSICHQQLSQFLQIGKICFNTVDEFKGLEAGYLILIDIIVANYSDNLYKNRLYIGCSRAKQGLYMLLNSPDEVDFETAMNMLETKKKIKKNRTNFYHKLAVTEFHL
ncbi:nuclease-related domain-containing DEAD/DEAH box helicase [Pontibacter chitinilyticus]|uniref:nuclease-related domain-containing DEAD/DEAH box helicase n=1 Tax=Pontibacter chitinilyticus TaxID=2674989 RepID=UPI003219692E